MHFGYEIKKIKIKKHISSNVSIFLTHLLLPQRRYFQLLLKEKEEKKCLYEFSEDFCKDTPNPCLMRQENSIPN